MTGVDASVSDCGQDADRGIRRWAGAIIGEIEAERRALADRINNDPVQTMAHIARVLKSLEDIPGTPVESAKATRELGLLADELSEQLRCLARELRPPLLDDVGLGAALNQLADDFAEATGIPTFSDPGGVIDVGTPEVGLTLFRVAQAALRNAEHYAAPGRIEIRLRREESVVTLTVTDDGVGLVDKLPGGSSPEVLVEMQQRLMVVGGRLEVTSLAQQGTSVRASVPVAARGNRWVVARLEA